MNAVYAPPRPTTTTIPGRYGVTDCANASAPEWSPLQPDYNATLTDRPALTPRGRIARRALAQQVARFRELFRTLADEWHEETDHVSSPTRKYMHPAYQRIISLGLQALPFILGDLQTRGGDWYWALSVITGGASPVPDDAAGDVRRIKTAWLDWGRQNGYIS